MDIRDKLPIIDGLIEFAKESVRRNGKVDIYTYLHPDSIARALDTEFAARKFLPKKYIKEVKCEEDALELRLKVYNERSQTNFHFDKQVPDSLSEPRLSETGFIIIENEKTHKKISISGVPTKPHAINPLINRIPNQIALPDPRGQCELGFGFANPNNFYVPLIYQQIEPTPKSNEVKSVYPISCYNRYVLKQEAFRFFSQPLYWDGLSGWNVLALEVMMGKKNKEALLKNSTGIERKFFEDAEKITRWLIKDINAGKDPSETCDLLKCPPEFRGFFLSRSLKMLNFYLNKDTLNPSHPNHAYGSRIAKACDLSFEKLIGSLELVKSINKQNSAIMSYSLPARLSE